MTGDPTPTILTFRWSTDQARYSSNMPNLVDREAWETNLPRPPIYVACKRCGRIACGCTQGPS